MDFTLSEDRQMLADSLGRFLADRYDFPARQRFAESETGYSGEIWQALAELGIIGALFDEDVGGFAGGGFDIALLFEAFGRALVVEPFLGTLLAGSVLARAGGQDERLGAMIAGSCMAVLAHQEPQGRYALDAVEARAIGDSDGWRLTGMKAVIPQAETADLFLVSARVEGDEGFSLFLVPGGAPDLEVRGYPMIDGGRGGDVMLTDVAVGADALLGRRGEGLALVEAATAAGIVALCAEAVGAMEAIKDATVEYLRTRTQFGVPIGKFQALQHRMATLVLEMEQARSAMINAAAALEAPRDIRERAVSAAKYTIDRVGTLVAEEAIQMHGGIGMTWELPVPHYAKRLIMIGHQLGDEDHHLSRYIRLGEQALA
jgi:alkylation response protein AidB-like acyl-CoA dehydrogenase